MSGFDLELGGEEDAATTAIQSSVSLGSFSPEQSRSSGRLPLTRPRVFYILAVFDSSVRPPKHQVPFDILK